MKRLARLAVRLLVAAAASGLWELGTRAAGDSYFPPPSAILAVMYRRWFSGPAGHLWLTADATGNLLPSLGRMLSGWAIASLAGIAAGVAIGRLPLLADVTEPMVHFGRAIPAPALVPVFFFLFKIGTQMEVAAIIFGVIWPVDADPEIWGPLCELSETIRTGEAPFVARNGNLYSYLGPRPGVSAVFDELMAAMHAPIAARLAQHAAFSGMRTLVDVGGGKGMFLTTILRANPGLRGVLLELERSARP